MTSTRDDIAETNANRASWRVIRVRQSGLATYPRGARLGPRTIPDFEFVWIIDGEATITYGGADWRLRPGDLALVAPGVLHEFAWNPRGATRHGYIHFSLAETIPSTLTTAPLLQGSDASRLCMLLGHLLTVAKRAGAGEVAAQVILHAGISFVLQSYVVETRQRQQSAADRPSHPALQRALRRIESQNRGGVTAPLAPRDLARHVRLSEAHLNRLAKARFGLRLSALLRNGRLNYAVELLDRTDLPIKAISYSCGYNNPFAFSRAFKAAFGVAPVEMRAALRGGAPRPPALPEMK